MKDSLKNLIKMYPYFFNKDSSSNFYKSQWVTNQRLKDVYQALFELVESFKLDKRCLVWREQTSPYVYCINFVCNFPDLKTVTLYKNDDVIYSTSYSYESHTSNFNYSYEDNTVNGFVGDNPPIIPIDNFKIIAETWDEYLIEKGYPENDVSQGNVYDHDNSLDEIGALNNIPRKEYLIVGAELYPSTEPPFNNRASEDDYHYIQRMLEYNLRLHTDPPVLLELWKLYGIEATMENRESKLIKFFDMNAHPNFKDPNADGDKWFSGTLEEDGTITSWTPKPWEHKDKFCDYSQYQGLYFFIQCSTNNPTRRQIVELTFFLVNGHGEFITDDSYLFDIYLDDELIKRNHNEWSFEIPPSYLSDVDETTITVECRTPEGLVGTAKIELRIRGCADADFFVNIDDGSDSNNGRTPDTAFKTIQKACSSCIGTNDLIAICGGEYTITSAIDIVKTCTLMACSETTIENTTDNRFFRISTGKELSIQDLNLEYNGESNNIADGKFINNNSEETIYVIGGSLGLPPYVPPPVEFPDLIKNLSYSNNVISYDKVTIYELDDLNGVIYDLAYTSGVISYKVFELSGDELTDEEWEELETAVCELKYENKSIKYNVVGVIPHD